MTDELLYEYRTILIANSYLSRDHIAVVTTPLGSLKIIGSGTIGQLGYGFYSHSIATVVVSLAVATQYTNVTDRNRTTSYVALTHSTARQKRCHVEKECADVI